MGEKVNIEFTKEELDKIIQYMDVGNFETVQDAIVDAVIKETIIKKMAMNGDYTDDSNPIPISAEGYDGGIGTCQNCRKSVPKFTTTVTPTRFCPHCGRALKWCE